MIQGTRCIPRCVGECAGGEDPARVWRGGGEGDSVSVRGRGGRRMLGSREDVSKVLVEFAVLQESS